MVLRTAPARDVYSFAMVLFEIFTEEIPFHDLPLKQVQSMIEEQQFRPKLKEYLPAALIQLIKHCWQQDPANRPSIGTVL